MTHKKKTIRVLSTVKWSTALFCAASINVGHVLANQSADIDVSATINVPISVTCNTNVQFGTLAILSMSNLTDATLEMNPDDVVSLSSDDGIANNFNQSGASFGECVVSGVSGDFTAAFTNAPVLLGNSSGTDSIDFEPSIQGTNQSGFSAQELFEYNNLSNTSTTWSVNGDGDEVTIIVGGHLIFPTDAGSGNPLTADFLSGTHTGTVTMEIVL